MQGIPGLRDDRGWKARARLSRGKFEECFARRADRAGTKVRDRRVNRAPRENASRGVAFVPRISQGFALTRAAVGLSGSKETIKGPRGTLWVPLGPRKSPPKSLSVSAYWV